MIPTGYINEFLIESKSEGTEFNKTNLTTHLSETKTKNFNPVTTVC
jgi:hypothetical protein